VGAPKAGGPQDAVEAHGSKGPTVGAAGGDGSRSLAQPLQWALRY
jgi:hypothetical protein